MEIVGIGLGGRTRGDLHQRQRETRVVLKHREPGVAAEPAQVEILLEKTGRGGHVRHHEVQMVESHDWLASAVLAGIEPG
jgi:hypothetical protein